MGKRGNGEGSIGRYNGTWIARLSTVAPDGTPKRKSFSGKTRKEAWDRLLKYRSEYQRYEEVSSQRFGDYLNRWLEDSASYNLKPATLVRYRGIVRNHLIPALGRIKLSDITAAHLQRLYREKLDEGMAPGTVRQIHAVAGVALKQAKRWRLLEYNPAEDATAPRNAPIRESRVITAQEAGRLFEAVREFRGGRYYALFVLAVSTGMRQGELLALRWGDVDLDKGELVVEQTVQYIEGKWVYGTPKSGKSRSIKLPDGAVTALKEHRRRQLEARVKIKEWENPELVFTGPTGSVIRRPVLQRDFERLLDNLGLPKITFHELRHSAATLLLEGGGNIKATQKLLGHSSIRITLDCYSHVTEKLEEETARKMGAALFGGESG